MYTLYTLSIEGAMEGDYIASFLRTGVDVSADLIPSPRNIHPDFGVRPIFPLRFRATKNAAKLALRTRHYYSQRSDSSPLKAHSSPGRYAEQMLF